ncbi:co-chaperone YbbN [Lacinutrix sp. Hel_I_90]|uniref:thioredoxin family protein n=1 Tax=Lacinutrix sp. Hel_I_90 TaxID=1249999 RepID=UPI0005C92F07|nr:thioredoxin domain-containing protein [Lacinutrix sp. Hel_I_90]
MNEFLEIINQDTPVLLDFFGEWCSPCKMMNPILNQALAAKYQAKGLPTLLLFKKGQQVYRPSGVLQKDELINIITGSY